MTTAESVSRLAHQRPFDRDLDLLGSATGADEPSKAPDVIVVSVGQYKNMGTELRCSYSQVCMGRPQVDAHSR